MEETLPNKAVFCPPCSPSDTTCCCCNEDHNGEDTTRHCNTVSIQHRQGRESLPSLDSSRTGWWSTFGTIMVGVCSLLLIRMALNFSGTPWRSFAGMRMLILVQQKVLRYAHCSIRCWPTMSTEKFTSRTRSLEKTATLARQCMYACH